MKKIIFQCCRSVPYRFPDLDYPLIVLAATKEKTINFAQKIKFTLKVKHLMKNKLDLKPAKNLKMETLSNAYPPSRIVDGWVGR